MNGEIKEQLAPESMRALIGSAVGFNIVIWVCKSGDDDFLFVLAIQQINSILLSIRGMQLAATGSPTLFPIPTQVLLQPLWLSHPFFSLFLLCNLSSICWNIP